MVCAAGGVARARPVQNAAAALASPAVPRISDLEIAATGSPCSEAVPELSGSDSEAATQSVHIGDGDVPPIVNYEFACVEDAGATSVTHTESAPKLCHDGAAPLRTSYEDATFADGEEVLMCDNPSVVPSSKGGYSNLRTKTFGFVAQGFDCEATLGTGPNGTDETVLTSSDAIEFDETFKNLNGRSVAAITTACVGTVPANVVISASPATEQQLPCSLPNPFGTGAVTATGVSVTFPDRQFEEICETPNSPPKLAGTVAGGDG